MGSPTTPQTQPQPQPQPPSGKPNPSIPKWAESLKTAASSPIGQRVASGLGSAVGAFFIPDQIRAVTGDKSQLTDSQRFLNSTDLTTNAIGTVLGIAKATLGKNANPLVLKALAMYATARAGFTFGEWGSPFKAYDAVNEYDALEELERQQPNKDSLLVERERLAENSGGKLSPLDTAKMSYHRLRRIAIETDGFPSGLVDLARADADGETLHTSEKTTIGKLSPNNKALFEQIRNARKKITGLQTSAWHAAAAEVQATNSTTVIPEGTAATVVSPTPTTNTQRPAARKAPGQKKPANFATAKMPASPTIAPQISAGAAAVKAATEVTSDTLEVKQEKLKELLQRYLSDKITPREYHQQRAKIVGINQPQPTIPPSANNSPQAANSPSAASTVPTPNQVAAAANGAAASASAAATSPTPTKKTQRAAPKTQRAAPKTPPAGLLTTDQYHEKRLKILRKHGVGPSDTEEERDRELKKLEGRYLTTPRSTSPTVEVASVKGETSIDQGVAAGIKVPSDTPAPPESKTIVELQSEFHAKAAALAAKNREEELKYLFKKATEVKDERGRDPERVERERSLAWENYERLANRTNMADNPGKVSNYLFDANRRMKNLDQGVAAGIKVPRDTPAPTKSKSIVELQADFREKAAKIAAENREEQLQFLFDKDESFALFDSSPEAERARDAYKALADKTNTDIAIDRQNRRNARREKKNAAAASLSSGGYVPNFSSLKNSVGREESGLRSRGINPSGKIYFGTHPSLPNGGIANIVDEPMGIGQGVSRAMSEGRNPRAYGSSGGFVPNFIADEKLSNSAGTSALVAAMMSNNEALRENSLAQQASALISASTVGAVRAIIDQMNKSSGGSGTGVAGEQNTEQYKAQLSDAGVVKGGARGNSQQQQQQQSQQPVAQQQKRRDPIQGNVVAQFDFLSAELQKLASTMANLQIQMTVFNESAGKASQKLNDLGGGAAPTTK